MGGGGPEDLVAAYAAAVDARDWGALGALFTDDAVLVRPDPPRSMEPVHESRGRAAIVEAVQVVSVFDRTEHLVTSTSWTGDGASASGRTRGEAHHVVLGADPHSWVWLVEYADDCLLTEVGWRFTRRALTVLGIERRPVS